MGVAVSLPLGIIAYKIATADTKVRQPRCRLLELPAELRVRIYEDALLQEDRVEITKRSFAQPGLLRTCRQIRHEASTIHYNKNKFSVWALGFDSGVLKRFCTQAAGFWDNYDLERMDVVLHNHRVQPSWGNVLKWMKAYHADEVMMLVCGPHVGGHERCCAHESASKIVSTLDDADWEVVKAVLEVLKTATENQANGRWYWE